MNPKDFKITHPEILSQGVYIVQISEIKFRSPNVQFHDNGEKNGESKVKFERTHYMLCNICANLES